MKLNNLFAIALLVAGSSVKGMNQAESQVETKAQSAQKQDVKKINLQERMQKKKLERLQAEAKSFSETAATKIKAIENESLRTVAYNCFNFFDLQINNLAVRAGCENQHATSAKLGGDMHYLIECFDVLLDTADENEFRQIAFGLQCCLDSDQRLTRDFGSLHQYLQNSKIFCTPEDRKTLGEAFYGFTTEYDFALLDD